MLLHRNEDRHIKANSKCYILNKSFPTKTYHNPAESRRIVTNNLHVHRGTEGNDKTKESQMQTQDDYSADFRGLPTSPLVLTQEDRRCKVGNATIKQCTKAGIALELDSQSENMVSDRNCTDMLHRGDKTAHLAGEEEQKIPHIFMEGNYTAKCSRVLQAFA